MSKSFKTTFAPGVGHLLIIDATFSGTLPNVTDFFLNFSFEFSFADLGRSELFKKSVPTEDDNGRFGLIDADSGLDRAIGFESCTENECNESFSANDRSAKRLLSELLSEEEVGLFSLEDFFIKVPYLT
jgi:hypothetical protein